MVGDDVAVLDIDDIQRTLVNSRLETLRHRSVVRQGDSRMAEHISPTNVYRVRIEVDEDGYYVAECLDLHGCISQGDTEEEALDNITDAIRGYLISMAKHAGESEQSNIRIVDAPVVAAVA